MMDLVSYSGGFTANHFASHSDKHEAALEHFSNVLS